jgi:hypothetical protein
LSRACGSLGEKYLHRKRRERREKQRRESTEEEFVIGQVLRCSGMHLLYLCFF